MRVLIQRIENGTEHEVFNGEMQPEEIDRFNKKHELFVGGQEQSRVAFNIEGTIRVTTGDMTPESVARCDAYNRFHIAAEVYRDELNQARSLAKEEADRLILAKLEAVTEIQRRMTWAQNR